MDANVIVIINDLLKLSKCGAVVRNKSNQYI